MKKIKILILIISSILFLVSCEKEQINKKSNSRTILNISSNDGKKENINLQRNKKVERNEFNICSTVNDTKYTTEEYKTHVNCMQGNKFYLYSLANVIYNSKTNDYRLISFTTRMDSIFTDYYLKDKGMKVVGKFSNNDTVLNIKVMLTKHKDSAAKNNKVIIDFTKENIKNLKLGNIIDFHIFTSNGRQQQRIDCPQFITKGITPNSKDDLKYNYCSSVIICE